jgi:hypothetical protein
MQNLPVSAINRLGWSSDGWVEAVCRYFAISWTYRARHVDESGKREHMVVNVSTARTRGRIYVDKIEKHRHILQVMSIAATSGMQYVDENGKYRHMIPHMSIASTHRHRYVEQARNCRRMSR